MKPPCSQSVSEPSGNGKKHSHPFGSSPSSRGKALHLCSTAFRLVRLHRWFASIAGPPPFWFAPMA
ncbi:MAG TPA: hypothetical protein VK513_13900, partial [Terriglobales bacterium]|nr:hypothetical protein [Terriglobales bacterium]